MSADNKAYQQVLERLYGEVARISSGTDWKNIAAASAILNRFSARNSVLVAIQARDRHLSVNHLAGYRNWQKLGRQVRSGERGFSILAPLFATPKAPPTRIRVNDELTTHHGDADKELLGFRWVSVFDISQTEGREIDGPIPELLVGDSPELSAVNQSLQRVVSEMGFGLEVADLPSANGLTDFSTRQIVLKAGLSGAQRAKTLAHEISHAQLHADGIISRQVAEIEAETSAYLIMAGLGVETDSYSFPYITSWSRGDLALVLGVAERAQECSRLIRARIANLATDTRSGAPSGSRDRQQS